MLKDRTGYTNGHQCTPMVLELYIDRITIKLHSVTYHLLLSLSERPLICDPYTRLEVLVETFRSSCNSYTVSSQLHPVLFRFSHLHSFRSPFKGRA